MDHSKEKSITCAVMYFTPSKKVLLVHPNGASWNCWSFPKGLRDPHESESEAAARELFEETGLSVDPSSLIDLGCSSYLPKKDYHLFLFRSSVEPPISQLICESTFQSRDGDTIPEVDHFQFTTLDIALRLLNKKQAEILSVLLSKPDLSLPMR